MGGATNILSLTGIRHTHTYVNINSTTNHPKPCSKRKQPLTTHSDPQNTGGLSHPRSRATTLSGHKTTHRDTPIYISIPPRASAYPHLRLGCRTCVRLVTVRVRSTTHRVTAHRDPTPTLSGLCYRRVSYPWVTRDDVRLSCLVIVTYLVW